MTMNDTWPSLQLIGAQQMRVVVFVLDSCLAKSGLGLAARWLSDEYAYLTLTRKGNNIS